MRRFLWWSLMLPLLACPANGQDVSEIDRTADTPAKATLLHFDGPLKPHFRIEAFKQQEHFIRGKEHLLGVSLVTKYPGVEWVQVSHEKGIPADIHPVVEITFPGETPDAKPTLLKVLLKHRC